MMDLRIIVVAPTGRDAQLICELLARNGLEAVPCLNCEAACEEAKKGVGAFLLADEALSPATIAPLSKVIALQPSWSDLPVIVLTGTGHSTPMSEARRKLREPLGNVILIERPVRPETLASTARSSIRARSRQYQARDFLRQEFLAAEALRKAEKLAVAGRLSATIAHEINNPLEAVTNLHYLMRSASSIEEIKAYLETADYELQRVIEITRQTLRFYRETSNAAPVEIPALLDSVLKFYERRLNTNSVAVHRQFEEGCSIVGFAGELRQVMFNLVSNALDAMPNGGRLHVRVRSTTQQRDGLQPGVRIVVADSGAGIPAAVRAKIMEPFVSTKQNTGTGLGLWVSSEIIRKHKGSIRYRSRVGEGTVFLVSLPCAGPQLDSSSERLNGVATPDAQSVVRVEGQKAS